MAEDKKKAKIDLKARLGKTTQTGMTAVPLPVPGATPSSQPGAPAPPSSDGGVPGPSIPVPTPSVRPPSGIAPPPGISPGIPLPPFAQRPSQREAPQKLSGAQQTIKVEVGEEIHEERKKAGKRTAIYAVLTLLLGLGAGFAIGGQKAQSDAGARGVKTAGDMEKEVKASNDKVKELGEKLQEAYEKLGKKEFPTELAATLGGLNLPFDAGNLDKPGVGNLGKALRPLLRYTKDVQELNEDKDQLKNVLGAVQAAAEKAWKEEKEPIVNYSVFFRPEGSKGIVAELVPNKEPFPIGKDFPKEYTITKLEQNKPVEKKATRWVKGDLTGSDPIAVPVDPKSMAGFTSEVLIQRLNKAIYDVRLILEGNSEDPTKPIPGLLKDGDELANELHKASQNQ